MASGKRPTPSAPWEPPGFRAIHSGEWLKFRSNWPFRVQVAAGLVASVRIRGGIGRRSGLKSRGRESGVRVRVPPDPRFFNRATATSNPGGFVINPPILAERRWWRLAVLCGLYVAQGVPFGFVTVTLAAAITKSMKDSGATNVQITEAISGIIPLCNSPLGIQVDCRPHSLNRFGIRNLGRRRPWILLAQLGMVLTLVQMALLPDPAGQLKALAWLAFAHSVFNALQDVSGGRACG